MAFAGKIAHTHNRTKNLTFMKHKTQRTT